MKHSTYVRAGSILLPTSIPERTFAQDLRADTKRYMVFGTPQMANSDFIMEKIKFESSFIDLYSLSRPDMSTNSVVGYCIDVKRGNVSNFGLALLIYKTRIPEVSKGCVDIDITQQLKLVDLLRLFKLGDSALFIGAVNDLPPFFY